MVVVVQGDPKAKCSFRKERPARRVDTCMHRNGTHRRKSERCGAILYTHTYIHTTSSPSPIPTITNHPTSKPRKSPIHNAIPPPLFPIYFVITINNTKMIISTTITHKLHPPPAFLPTLSSLPLALRICPACLSTPSSTSSNSPICPSNSSPMAVLRSRWREMECERESSWVSCWERMCEWWAWSWVFEREGSSR